MTGWDPKDTLDSLGLTRQGFKRSARVGQAIKNELSVLLVQTIRDRKLAEVSISRVVVTDDLKLARIFYTVLGEGKVGQAKSALEKAKGFMRSHLAKTLNMRFTPELQFLYDDKAEKVRDLEDIFQEIAEERRKSDQDT